MIEILVFVTVGERDQGWSVITAKGQSLRDALLDADIKAGDRYVKGWYRIDSGAGELVKDKEQ